MIQVDVTEDDIQHGVVEDCHNCPVALAICRAVGLPSSQVAVDGAIIEIGLKDYRTPEAVNDFIQKFDDGQPVEPFTFQIFQELRA